MLVKQLPLRQTRASSLDHASLWEEPRNATGSHFTEASHCRSQVKKVCGFVCLGPRHVQAGGVATIPVDIDRGHFTGRHTFELAMAKNVLNLPELTAKPHTYATQFSERSLCRNMHGVLQSNLMRQWLRDVLLRASRAQHRRCRGRPSCRRDGSRGSSRGAFCGSSGLWPESHAGLCNGVLVRIEQVLWKMLPQRGNLIFGWCVRVCDSLVQLVFGWGVFSTLHEA